MRAAGRSECGPRRAENQDRYAIAPRVLVVVDGMGGNAGGEVAAALAVEELRRRGDPVDRFRAANAAVFGRALEDPTVAGMGCVGARVELGASELRVSHVGDCRVFVAHGGGCTSLLTRPHTVQTELLDTHSLTEADAFVVPGSHQVTRDLGATSELPASDVDVATVAVEPGDLVMLCSDGLTDHLFNTEIYALLQAARGSGEPPADLVDRLVGLALDRGGRDNVTVVVARIDPETP